MFGSDQQFGSGASTGFYPQTIDQSLRFEDGDSAYLQWSNANKGTPTQARTWTFSAWVKRGNLGISSILLGSGTSTNNDVIWFFTDDKLRLEGRRGGSTVHNIVTNAVFRDTSAWYHIVFSYDSNQASASDRLTIYVNGVAQSVTVNNEVDSGQPSEFSETDTDVYIGRGQYGSSGTVAYNDGYMAELHFVDGTSYTADAFGELKSGIWVPKEVDVTHGNNGWYLNFSDSADLGNNALTTNGDNDFDTVSGLVASDVVPDSPTNNFAVLNVLENNTGQSAATAFREGNLRFYLQDTAGLCVSGNFAPTSGKWYWEQYVEQNGNNGYWSGLTPANLFKASGPADGVAYWAGGTIRIEGVDDATGQTTYTAADVVGIAVDMDGGTVDFYKNGGSSVYQATLPSSITDNGFKPNTTNGTNNGDQLGIYNFGQDSTFAGNVTAGGNSDANGIGDFKYAPPSGYLALCTSNLPDPVIDPAQDDTPEDYFNTVLYTGDGNTTQTVTGTGFQADLVWVKDRSTTYFHRLFDVVRGTGKELYSNDTSAEATDNTGGHLDSFDSDGFTIGGATTANFMNFNGNAYVAWNWKAGGTGVSNTDGSITSTVSANTDTGFSLVGYTGTDAINTVGHGLTQAPEMVIVKNRTDSATPWRVYHLYSNASDPEDYYLDLDSNGAASNATAFWNGTKPSTTVVSLSANNSVMNAKDYIMYCFHSVDGFSKVGSYIGNGSNDGPFVYTGFRPKWVMTKESSDTSQWHINDSERDLINPCDLPISANEPVAEPASTTQEIDFLSNGFKLRNSGSGRNTNGNTYIYLAFAEQPVKYSNGR